MSKEKFLLVSLSESKTQKLAQAVSNKSCRKILNYLSEKDATETELSKNLEIPISTVHYNLQQLQKAKLVDAQEYHYSKKGREILHYKLANKYIIIAPKSTYGIKEKLKSIIPAFLITIIGARIIDFFYNPKINLFGSSSVDEITHSAPKRMLSKTLESTPQSLETFADTQVNSLSTQEPNTMMYFILGILIAFLLYLLIDYIRNKNK